MSFAAEEELEEKIINESYKIWKKNVPFLYDMVVIHALEWPSLTVQWLPDQVQPPGKNFRENRVILGTHTSESDQNYLMLAKVTTPVEQDDDVDNRKYDGECIRSYKNEYRRSLSMLTLNFVNLLLHNAPPTNQATSEWTCSEACTNYQVNLQSIRKRRGGMGRTERR